MVKHHVKLYDSEEALEQDEPSQDYFVEDKINFGEYTSPAIIATILPGIGHTISVYDSESEESKEYLVFEVVHYASGDQIPTVRAKNKDLVDKLD